MRRTRVVPALIGATCSVLGASSLFAQTPIGTQPKIAVEVITLKSVKFETTTGPTVLRYLRAGTTPQQYRAGMKSDVSDGIWTPLNETQTSTTVIDGISWVSAQLRPSGKFMGTDGCPKNTFKRVVYLQMKGVNKAQVPLTSNIVTDSLCVPLG